MNKRAEMVMARTNSLAARFILAVVLVLIVGQGLLWFAFIFGQKSRLTESLTSKVGVSAEMLDKFTLAAEKSGDYTALDSLIAVMASDKDIISIKILDAHGEVVKYKVYNNDVAPDKVPLLHISNANLMRRPVKDGSQIMGTIEVVYSGRPVNGTINWLLTYPPIGQILVFALITFAVFKIFRKWVSRPIDELLKRMNSITNGDLTVSIDVEAAYEIGEVTSGLKFLKETLVENITNLNSIADNVSMAIKQLEATFQGANESMKTQSNSFEEILDSVKNARESHKNITDSTDILSGLSSENVTSLLQMRSAADEIVLNTNNLTQTLDGAYSVVSEMSSNAKSISNNAGYVLSAVEDTSASVEQISASVKEIEKSARESSALAESVRGVAAEKGVLTVAEAIEAMEKISEKVKYSVDIVTRLGARSKDIEKMLQVIKEVTEQTNLLSLNAAILAVQAGEYGKGFSVVAEEIRALSDRTAVSTKEIAGIVTTIQKEINEVVVSIEDGMMLVEEGSSMVFAAGENIAYVVEEAQKSARMSKSIERATEEQARGLTQIMSSVDRIRDMASQMAQATEEQSRGANFMLERIVDVKDAAESTRKGTTEQAQGIKLISRNIETTADRINDINQSALRQQEINDDIVTSVEGVRHSVVIISTDIESVAGSLSTLGEEIQALKKGMAAFKLL